jgi:hypothetical protein
MHEFTPPPIIQPDIHLWGLRIAEPVTSLTALMIALCCFWAWRRMSKRKIQNTVLFYIRAFFLLLGLATTSGALIGHAFLYQLSFEWKVPGWVLSMVGIAALERAAILHAKPLMRPAWGNFFSVFNIVELILILSLALYTLNFHFVEIHAGYGLVVVVGLFEGYVYWKKRDIGALLILSAIPIATIAVIVHLCLFSFSVWFTYFDIGHILMCICIPFMLRGAERMQFYVDSV